MKKALLALLLCLATLGTLVGCAKEQHDLLYQTEENGVTYCVRGSGTRAKQVVVKEGADVVWSQKVKVSSAVGTRGGSYGFEVLDLNFDGHDDFMIANDHAGESTSYLCWLWDTEKSTYVQSKELSGLCNVKTDEKLKAVFSFSHTYQSEEAYLDVPASSISTDSSTKYQWKDGVLLPKIRVSITYYSENDKYCYSVAYYDEALGKFEDSDDKWLTPEEYKTYDMSFLYYFK